MVVAKAQDNGDVQGAVAGEVATAVKPMPVRFAGRGRDRRDAAEVREGGLASRPVGVVADGDEQRRDGVWAEPEDRAGRRCGRDGQLVELPLECTRFEFEAVRAGGD